METNSITLVEDYCGGISPALHYILNPICRVISTLLCPVVKPLKNIVDSNVKKALVYFAHTKNGKVLFLLYYYQCLVLVCGVHPGASEMRPCAFQE